MKKLFTLTCIFIFVSNIFAQSVELWNVPLMSVANFINCSKNGRYACGSGMGSAAIGDFENRGNANGVYEFINEPGGTFYEVWDVSDAGKACGATGPDGGEYNACTFENGVITMLQKPTGNFFEGSVRAISADGNLCVGYYNAGSGTLKPILWKNGVPQQLPLPTIDPMGQTEYLGAIPTGISDDGNTIFGRFVPYIGNVSEIPFVWHKNGETYSWEYLGDSLMFDYTKPPMVGGFWNMEFFKDFWFDISGSKMSRNGKYAMSMAKSSSGAKPCVIEIKSTGYELKMLSNESGTAISATSAGMFMYATPSFAYARNAHLVKEGQTATIPFETYLQNEFGYDILSEIPSSGTTGSNDIGSMFYGFTVDENDLQINFMLKLPGIGIDEYEKTKSLFSIFPNPAKAETNILISNVEGDVVIKIYDISGKEISFQTESVSMPKTSVKLNTSSLSSGTYFVKLITKNTVSVQKLIIQ